VKAKPAPTREDYPGGSGKTKGNTSSFNATKTAAYFAARIARDRPDILERMKAGEFRSIRAAALEAGIVDPSFQCPDDPVKAARRVFKHFPDNDLRIFRAELKRLAGDREE
jgi:hypothetical protein